MADEQSEAHHHQKMRMDAANEAFKSTIAAAGAALRILATVNAGSIIALMGFIGATADKGIYPTFLIFSPPLKTFGSGLFFAVIATVGMYCAQGCFQKQVSSVRFLSIHPYVEEQPIATVYKWLGRTFQVASIGSGLAALVLFGRGLGEALHIFSFITVPT